MAFLNRIFRNRGLLENLGREPLAPTLEPIRPRPIVTPFVPPQPVLPFPERLPDPFERLPIEDPRDDFLSIQRLDDRPPAASPLQQAFERIQNQQLPVLLPPEQQGLSPVAPVNTGPIKLFGQTLSQEDSDRIREGGSYRDAIKKLIPEISDEERAKLPSVFGPPLPPQPPSIGGIGGINQDPRPLERPIIPPKRDDFMSIERIGDGGTPIPNDGTLGDLPPGLRMSEIPPTSGPVMPPGGPIPMKPIRTGNYNLERRRPPLRDTGGNVPGGGGTDLREAGFLNMPEVIFDGPTVSMEEAEASARNAGAGRRAFLPEGFSFDRPGGIYTSVMPPPGFVYAYGPDGERRAVPSGEPGAAELRDKGMAIDQAFLDFQKTNPGEPFLGGLTPPATTDPIVKPAPTTPAAVATDVGAVPVTTIPEDVRGQVDPVLTQQDTRELQTDPLLRALYFGTADQPGFINQLQQATANLIASDVPLQQTAGLSELEQIAQDRALADLGVAEPFVGESADLIRGTTRQFDPSMTQQFFNPFEDQVVQQTIQDVLEAGEKRDIAQRARDIRTGGLSAFGSRARLTAADRQEALGRGLAEALGGIRQAGFGQAQRDAITTFAQQRQAEQQAARDLGQVGTTLADLRAGERRGLAGFGQTGRDIEETALSRLFKQQIDQQGRPLTALQLTGQLLPQFQAGSTQIDSEYRLPVDPSQRGLGAALSTFTALAPGQTTDLSKLGAAFSGYGTSS